MEWYHPDPVLHNNLKAENCLEARGLVFLQSYSECYNPTATIDFLGKIVKHMVAIRTRNSMMDMDCIHICAMKNGILRSVFP